MESITAWWTQTHWPALIPGGVVVALAGALMVLEVVRPQWLRWVYYAVITALVGLVLVILRGLFHRNYQVFGQALILDNTALVALMVYVITAAIVAIAVWPIWEAQPRQWSSWTALLLLTLMGMLAMTASPDTLAIFLGMEIMSLSLYVMIAYERPSPAALESALKYFLLGAFAAAIFAYGIALLYGATGSTSLIDLTQRVEELQDTPRLWVAYLGLALMLVGLGFEASVVPFHMWTPDVYHGAPTPTVAYMSVAVKAAAVGAMLRIFGSLMRGLPAAAEPWGYGLAAFAILTMTVGTVMALRQVHIKRLLAYSSIAHAGYMLVGLTAGGDAGREGVLLYMLAYLFMNTGAFLIVAALENWGISPTLDQYRSIGYRHPGWALALSVFMIALTGMPPTAGFIAKLWVFRAALTTDWVGPVVVGVITSLVSAYFYFRVIWTMFEPVTPEIRRRWRHWAEKPAIPNAGFALAVTLCCFFTVQIGVWPSRFAALVRLATGVF